MLFLVLATLSLLAHPAKVIKISDGDTITILQNKTQIKVRLYGIDAPELKQPYGQKSKQFLASLIAGQVVEIEPKGKDRYKRTLGTIYYKGQDINAQMVIDGYAWAYDKFSKDYVAFQQNAQLLKKGLWIDKDVVRPSDFRKLKKSSR